MSLDEWRGDRELRETDALDYAVSDADRQWLGEPGECEPPADQLGPEVPDWFVWLVGGVVLLLVACGIIAVARAIMSAITWGPM